MSSLIVPHTPLDSLVVPVPPSSPTVDPRAGVEFIKEAFAGIPKSNVIVLTALPSGVHQAITLDGDMSDVEDWIRRQSDAGQSLYFSGAAHDPKATNGTRSKKSARWLSFVIVDNDFQDTAHKGENLPPDFEWVRANLLPRLPRPSKIILSGHGCYLIWFLAEPIEITDGASLDRTQKIIAAMQGRVRSILNDHKYTCDETSDPSHLYRLPGSLNRKTGDTRQAHVMQSLGTGQAYDLVELLPEMTGPTSSPTVTPCPPSSPTPDVVDRLAAMLAPATTFAPTPAATTVTPTLTPAASAPVVTPTATPVDTRTDAEIIEAARDKLKRSRHADRRPIIAAFLAGKPYAHHGHRDLTTQKLASWIAMGDPNAAPETLAEMFRPSLEAMEAESPNDFLSVDDATKKIERAQEDVRRKRPAETERNERIMAALTGGSLANDNNDLVPVSSTSSADLMAAVDRARGELGKTLDRNISREEFATKHAVFQVPDGGFRVWSAKSGQHEAVTAAQFMTWLDRRFQMPKELWSAWGLDVDKKGKSKHKGLQQIASEIVWPVSRLGLDMRIAHAFYDEPENILHVPTARPRALEPRFDAQVDRWLHLLCGDDFEIIMDWLAGCTRLDRPCCALCVLGTPGSGKSMIAEGISRQFIDGPPTRANDLFSRFNDRVATCPIVNQDEKPAVDDMGRPVTVDAWKEAISSGKFLVNKKYGGQADLFGHLRIVFTANRMDILVGADESTTADDREALAVRFRVVRPPKAAAEYLKSLGGREAGTKGWVDGDEKVACHIRHLIETRHVQPKPGNRFLVDGNGDVLADELATLNSRARLFLEAAAAIVWGEIKLPSNKKAFVVGNGRVLFRPLVIANMWSTLIAHSQDDARRARPDSLALSRDLEGLAVSKKVRYPRGGDWYWSLRIDALLDFAEETGRDRDETQRRIDLPLAEFEQAPKGSSCLKSFAAAVAAAPAPAKEAN